MPEREGKHAGDVRAQALQRVAQGEDIAVVAKDLGVAQRTLRGWIKSAKPSEKAEAGNAAAELARLQAENAALRKALEAAGNPQSTSPRVVPDEKITGFIRRNKIFLKKMATSPYIRKRKVSAKKR